MPPIRVAVHGINGRMGREVLAALCKEEGLEPVGGVDIAGAGASISLPKGSSIPFSTNLAELLDVAKPSVMVDFTTAEACVSGARIALPKKVALVAGTTGLTEANLKEIDTLARENGVGAFVAPNFALGAVLLMHLAKIASPFFEYVDIVEEHHETKIDSPSGTALAIARAVAGSRKLKRNVPQKEPLAGTRGGDLSGISIHSVRQPGRMAHHSVIFGIAGQTLTLRHDTINRECYMPGVMRAVHEVVKFKGLVVGLDKLLGL